MIIYMHFNVCKIKFQVPFNVVKYRIIGDDSATTFFDIDQNFGNVTLKSSVNFDTTSNYKVRCVFDFKGMSENIFFDYQSF
jgi:hypothetical protein